MQTQTLSALLPQLTPAHPAAAATPKAFLHRARQMLYTWDQRARSRQILRHLDQRTLADIGLNPHRRDLECAKPLWKP